MKILKIPHDIKFGKINISSQIFIRSSYQTLLSKLLERKETSILIGTPGIGKSHFALYFAYSLIQRGIPFVLDTAYSGAKDNFFFFNPDGYIVFSDQDSILLEISKFKFVWYIVDGCEPRDLDHPSINQFYIDSAKMQKVKDFHKAHIGSPRFCLPCWELDEINTCRCNHLSSTVTILNCILRVLCLIKAFQSATSIK